MEKVDLSSDYDKYISYLESDIWAEKRNKTLERDKYHCTICNNPNNLEVHHLRYPDILGTESISDLMTLCRGCHKNMEEYKKGHSPLRIMGWHPPKKYKYDWVQFETKEDYADFRNQHENFFGADSDYSLDVYIKKTKEVKKNVYINKEGLEYCKKYLDHKTVEKWERW